MFTLPSCSPGGGSFSSSILVMLSHFLLSVQEKATASNVTMSDDDSQEVDPAELRCQHFSSPTALFTTPLLGDFDANGRLDVSYIVVWESAYDAAFKTLLIASDLESLFTETYGKEVLDFETFFPLNKQPWTQYMGQKGDSVFIPPKT